MQVRYPPDHQPGGVGLDRDVGEQLLDQLERRRSACRTGCAGRVADRGVQAPLRQPDAPGGDRHAALGQCTHGYGDPATFLPEQRRPRHPNPGERQLGGGLATQPELAVHGGPGESRAIRRHQERRDAPCPVAAGPGEDQRQIRPGPVRDEHLLAGDQPVVAVARRRRAQRGSVRTGVRFGQSETADCRAGAQPGEATRAAARRCRTPGRSSRRARARPRRCRGSHCRPGPAPRATRQ